MLTSLTNIADSQLLQLLAKGDSDAFTEIYNRYWEKLLFIAGIKFRDLAVAEEMVQDVFLDVWNRRSEMGNVVNLEGYLAVSMKYKVINAQAKLKHHTNYQNHIAANGLTFDNSTEEWLKFQELQEKLSKLVSKLPEKCRITYQLSKDYGLSHKEIATKLNVSEKAVEANLARAVKSLRKAFSSFMSSVFYNF